MSNLEPLVQIGSWHYQVIYGQLWPSSGCTKAEDMIRLEPRLHSLLNYFLQHPNKLIAKDTLLEKVWPEDEGTDAAVMRAVGALRKILGDDARTPAYIATVSKKGYCWLAAITPLLKINLPTDSVADAFTDTAPPQSTDTNGKPVWSTFRFILNTAFAVIAGCATVAYLLARYTVAPLLKLPDTVVPISALSGQEYWPLLTTDGSSILYQHKALDSRSLNWSRQDLQSQQVSYAQQQFLRISQAQWLDNQQIVFRAQQTQHDCYFYSQSVLPEFGAPERLWQCQQFMPHGVVHWRGQLLWIDRIKGRDGFEIWQTTAAGTKALIKELPFAWRDVSQLLIQHDGLFMLVNDSEMNSSLVSFSLPDGEIEVLKTFPYALENMSWWDEDNLLLSGANQETELVNLDSLQSTGLGALTRQLVQAQPFPTRILATQYLDYTTDIYTYRPDSSAEQPTLTPWQVSNRSESMLAIAPDRIAYVSARAGNNQVWLENDNDSRQLTKLDDSQQIQQLFWHKQQLMAVINNVLFSLSAEGELHELSLDVSTVGRFVSCNNTLFWTGKYADEWQLMQHGSKQSLMAKVVDARCAPEGGLVLQFSDKTELAILRQGELTPLPIAIDWRETSAEQWFTNDKGVYWLDENKHSVNFLAWGSRITEQRHWQLDRWPLAIASDSKGLGYVVLPRPFDTDIVWLQNRF